MAIDPATQQAITAEQQAALDRLVRDGPEDFGSRKDHLLRVRAALAEAMASAIGPALNEYLALQPQQTIEERRELAAALNESLRSLGLAIRCPRTGRPAILIVDTLAGEQSHVSRFRLQTTDERGKLKRTVTDLDLPLPLEFTPAAPRKESFSRAFKSGDAGRGGTSR